MSIENCFELWIAALPSNVTSACFFVNGLSLDIWLSAANVTDRDLMEEAVTLALASGQALYDFLYLALALRQGCEMITADGKFHTAETAVAAFPNVLALWTSIASRRASMSASGSQPK
jgi:hypothetical protein